MTITVGTDTYVSLAEADVYFASLNATVAAVWDAKTDPEKEAALWAATDYMEVVYGGRWKGQIVDYDQVLAWPRAGVTDLEGRAIDDAVYPTRLERAECELAYKTFSADLLTDTDAGGALKRKKTGPLEKEWFPGASVYKRYEYVDQLVGPYLFNTSRVSVPLIRG